MNDIFEEKSAHHSLRNTNHLKLPRVRTLAYGTEDIKYRGCILWSSLSNELKNCQSLNQFKQNIKKWNTDNCTCRLFLVYIQNIGYINGIITM